MCWGRYWSTLVLLLMLLKEQSSKILQKWGETKEHMLRVVSPSWLNMLPLLDWTCMWWKWPYIHVTFVYYDWKFRLGRTTTYSDTIAKIKNQNFLGSLLDIENFLSFNKNQNFFGSKFTITQVKYNLTKVNSCWFRLQSI